MIFITITIITNKPDHHQEAMNMEVNDPERADLFRKYGAIYGRFDSKRSKDKQLNFHEVLGALCVMQEVVGWLVGK